MSTRNPMNKRSQERSQGGTSGMARKSASSAKPARPAAGSVRVVASSGKAKRAQMERGEDLSNLSKEERKARKAELRRQEDRVYAVTDILMKENELYPRYRRIWWMLVITGIASLVATWVVLGIMGEGGTAQMGALEIVLLVFAYAAVILALVFDLWKIRPIRKEVRAIAEGMSEARMNDVLERGAKK